MAAWPLGVAIVAVLPLGTALSSARTLSWRDTAQLQGPVHSLVATALRSFGLPLWNPLEGTGQPLLAQWLHSVLHPVTAAVGLLQVGVDGWLLSLIAFAAAGTFVAGLGLGLSRPAAAGAALAYSLSGYVLGMTCNVQYLTGAATAPWVVAGLVRAARGGAAVFTCGAVAIACAIFSGDPQAVIASALVGGALALADSRGAALRAGLRRIALSGGLGVALSAIQLLPTVSYLRTTARWAGDLSPEDLAYWSLDPSRLIELAAPGFFVGRPAHWVAPVYQALGSPSPYPLPWAPSVFIGAAVLLLAAAAWTRRSGRVLLGLSLLFLFLALGRHLGAQQLLAGVPIWGTFRYAEKLVGPLTLCLSLAAGLGIDAARETPWLGRAALATALAFLGIGLLCALAPSWTAALLSTARGPAEAGALARAHLLEGSIHAALGAGAIAILLRFVRADAPWVPAALAILLFAQSAAAVPFAVHLGDARAQLACPPPLAAPPPGPRVFTALIHNVGTPVPGLDPIDRLHQQIGELGVPSANVRCGLDSLEGYTGFETARAQATIWDPASRQALARRLGVTHVTSEAPRDPAEAALLRAATAGGTLLVMTDRLGVWSVPHRPWASFASSVRTVPDLRAALPALQLESSSPTGAVIVESEAPLATAPGRVLSVRRAAEELELEAEAEGPSLLVVNDAWAEGWQATIDGAPAAVLPADVLVRAIPFPAGRHRLAMRYAPWEVKAGGWITLLTLVGSIAYTAAWAWRRRGEVTVSEPLPRSS
jgi:hypothetical protein